MYQYPYGNAQQLNLDWILSKIQEIEAGSTQVNIEEVANALISASFDAGVSYRRYDYCFYNGKLYRALNDTTGAFNPADWLEVVIGDDIPVLTRLLNAVDASLTSLQTTVDDLDSDDVDNASNVTGTSVSDALDTLLTTLGDILPLDTVPTADSTKGITSNAVKEIIAFNPYDLPSGNITTLDYLKNNITSNGIWMHYFYLPSYNFVGWGKIVAIVAGTYKKIYITLVNYNAYLGTDDGITWSDLIVTPILTHAYETTANMQTSFVNELETAFTNAANYSLFSGGSGAGNEGGWICFKHSTVAMGVLFNYFCGVCALRRDSTGTWEAKTIFKF